jgi:hypothetical protein
MKNAVANIIGREGELDVLTQLTNSTKPEFLALFL